MSRLFRNDSPNALTREQAVALEKTRRKQRAEQARELAAQSRGGDTEIAHVTLGELVIPRILQTPELVEALRRAAAASNIPFDALRIGSRQNRINPNTGVAEFSEEEDQKQGGQNDGGGMEGITVSVPRYQEPVFVPSIPNTFGAVDAAKEIAQTEPAPQSPPTPQEIEEVVVKAIRNKNLGGVVPNLHLQWPNEQMWVLRNRKFEFLGDHGGRFRKGANGGAVGENRAKTAPGYDAIIHTHPDWANPDPGDHDAGYPVPMFGITPNDIWVIRPGETKPVWLGRR